MTYYSESVDEIRAEHIAEIDAFASVLRNNRVKKLSDWDDTSRNVEFSVQVDFDTVRVKDEQGGQKGQITLSGPHNSRRLCFLPPVLLRFELPDDYPLKSSPKFEIESYWMTEEQIEMCRMEVNTTLKKNEGIIVLFSCYYSLIESVKNLNITFIDLSTVSTQTEVNAQELFDKNVAVYEDLLDDLYDGKSVNCMTCSAYVRLPETFRFIKCRHVFCKTCVRTYYQRLVNRPINNHFLCPHPMCDTEAEQQVIKECLGELLYEKYDRALLEKCIRESGELFPCARRECQKPAQILDKNSNLVQCTFCEYNFCKLCGRAYHGSAECKIKKEEYEEIMRIYRTGEKEERIALNKKYGGISNVEDLVSRIPKMEWYTEKSKECPGCYAFIEKSDGCNMIHCIQCNVNSCLLCDEIIAGYTHFNEGTCAGRLFENTVSNAEAEL
ncbi:unnamed protein product [Caenorhabditis sp. 36 PRJEB53466]|nr:unnamed protein product [Caenorhabditis sp. 36 PRJEB53466]